jgi:phosphoribosylformimino-5-aminoimidazole carboxamide ribonucleotide (ProFAR) isomerase
MRIVPSIDLEKGRSRIVFWPGAATGVGAPTDQPARIARHFVDRGATLIHLVDFDGARAAVGFDPRPERIASFNWKRSSAPTAEALIDELAGAGVSRIVLSHGGNASESAAFASLAARQPTMELSVAGGVSDLDGVRRLRDAGVASLILGEALLSGAIDFEEASRISDPAQ